MKQLEVCRWSVRDLCCRSLRFNTSSLFPSRPPHIKDYKDQVSFPEYLWMRMCVCVFPLQTKRGTQSFLAFELSYWLIWREQLNNTSVHTGGHPHPVYLQGSGGNRLSFTILHPRETSACWAPDSCTWPTQLGLLERRIKPCTVHITQTSCPFLPHSHKLVSLGTVCLIRLDGPFVLVLCAYVWVCLRDILFHPTGGGVLADPVIKPSSH